MGCISSFSDLVASSVNGSFKDDFIAELENLGVDPDTIDYIRNNLPEEVVLSSDIAASVTDLNISDKVSSAIKTSEVVKSSVANTDIQDYEPQNAIEGFSIPEPVISSKVDTVDQDPIVYRPRKKWWEKIYMDKIANLMKIDLKKFSIQFLHFKSKTQMKIDKQGNVTLYVKGNLKHIVEGNYSLEVRGDNSMVVGGDSYRVIKGLYSVEVGKTYDIDVSDVFTIDASNLLTKCSYKVEGSTTLNSTLNVSGNTTLSSNLTVGANVVVGANLTVSGVAKASGHI